MGTQSANHEYVGPEEVRREMRRAARSQSTPPQLRSMCNTVLRELSAFEQWCEPIFDQDEPRALKLAERACDLQEYAAFTLRVMRRAGLGEPLPPARADDEFTMATDEEIVSEVTDALAACRRYFWAVRNQK